MKKTQNVSYTGTGYFVVDLDHLTADNVIADKDKKTVTIQIDHAYLQAIEIDPNNIMIDEVEESLLARGEIKLTVSDCNAIERTLRSRLEEKFLRRPAGIIRDRPPYSENTWRPVRRPSGRALPALKINAPIFKY